MTTNSATAASGVPARLAEACAEVRPAGAADVVAGTAARFVAAPAATAEAAALLSAAGELGLTVLPRGSGSKLDWGAAPSACDLIVDTRRMDQVLEHAAGDLVVRVQAGLGLGDLGKTLTSAGQRLALDPPGGGTIGGILATQAAGPLRFRYGAPRDLLIGITVIRADGTVARSGGKVVKNVAGYDLGKLFAGSYGTLGLIAEATFRLHPQPEAAVAVTLECPDPAAAAAAVHAMASAPLAQSAVELCWPSGQVPMRVGVLLEGDEASVRGRADRMLGLLADQAPGGHGPAAVEPVAGPFRLAGSDGEGGGTTGDSTVIQVAFWAGRLAGVLGAIRGAAAELGLDPAISGSAGTGVLLVELPPGAPPDAVARFVAQVRSSVGGPGAGALPVAGSAVVLRAPAEVRDVVEMWGTPPSLGLMRSVKDQFDAGHRMAPGRFAGGI